MGRCVGAASSAVLSEMEEENLSSASHAPEEYYTWMMAATRVRVEACDSYVKQTYRNRCVIATAAGPLALTIPTEKGAQSKTLMRDVRISDHGNWRHQHWTAIQSAYKGSPFFEYYEDDFRPFYEQHYPFLYDFNASLCQLCCDLIDMHPTISATQDYLSPAAAAAAGLRDLREAIHPKHRYQDADPHFRAEAYYQVFRASSSAAGFMPNLSIIDLLFNMGPETLILLQRAIPN